MTSRRSTARSRDIGLELLAIREKAGFDGQRLADRLGWDQSKVSRIEGGKQAIDEIDLIHWLSTCNIKGTRLRKLVEFNREANQETWVLPVDPTPSESRNLITEERQAKAITMYACLLVPGILQTPEYARAIISLYYSDDATVARLLAARMARQELLRGEKSPKTVYYIEEAALRRPVGDSRIMHDQLMHLMFMADWKKVSIRVLRTGVGPHRAVEGAFALIERRDRCWVAFVSLLVTAVILEGDDHIAAYKVAINGLDQLALSEEESRAFIATLADEHGQPREGSDDGPSDMA